MKAIKSFLTALLLLAAFQATAQKVKIKKGIVTIDEVETYTVDSEGDTNTLAVNGNEFITYIENYYDKWVNGMRYRPCVLLVKFLVSGRTFYTELSDKDLIKAIYKSNMVGADGKIDEDKASIFVNKYENDSLKYKLQGN